MKGRQSREARGSQQIARRAGLIASRSISSLLVSKTIHEGEMMPSTRTRAPSPITLLSAIVLVATFSVFACSNSSSSGDGGATGGSTGIGGAMSGTGGGRGGETGAGGSSGGATGTGGQGGATAGTTGHGGGGGGGHGGSGAAGGGGGASATGGAGGEGGAQACLPNGSPCSSGRQCCSFICAGGCQMAVSDRNMKRDFAPVNDDEVLKAVDALPITSWSYKDDGTRARHIGPMAQDFMSTFHVGSNDKTILQVDGDGVSLAAIKALSQRVKELEARNRSLEEQVSALRAGLPRSHRAGETRRPSGAP